jgi:hypothetical protein
MKRATPLGFVPKCSILCGITERTLNLVMVLRIGCSEQEGRTFATRYTRYTRYNGCEHWAK